jgi:hypothetical protein
MDSDIERLIDERLESIAVELEQRRGNQLYMRAWQMAAAIVRSRKNGNTKPTRNVIFPAAKEMNRWH